MGVFPAKRKHIVYRYGHVENMTAHAVGSSSIKTVGTKKSSRGVCGQHLSIKEHADHIRIPCAKLHIVGDHNNGNALLFEIR